jgi:TIR domain
LIEYLPSLFNQPIQHYSCFISYSSKDDEFANRIHADLQNKGVRCWFAPHDLPIGGKILDEIDAAIRVREKIVLILSEHSINSGWVEDEVTAGFEEERSRGQIVLFPVRLDEAVMNTNEAWAAKLRARNIGDFRKWKDHDAYKQSLSRVLRDLTKPQEEGRGR